MRLSDEQLNQLAIAAQQFPLPERQTALTKLVAGIWHSGRLCRPYRGQFLEQYDEIHLEAVQDLLLYVCEHIDQYNPTRSSVLGWANMLLERRFFRDAIPKLLGKPGIQRITPETIEQIPAPENAPRLAELLKAAIEADPNNEFKQAHLQGLPHVNFQKVTLRRLEGQSWEEIAAEFSVKPGTVSCFYSRCVKRFATTLRQFCTE